MFNHTAILVTIAFLCVALILLLCVILVLVNSDDKKDALKKMFSVASIVSLAGMIGGWVRG